MNAKASVCLPIKSKKQLAALVDALMPEIKKVIGVRSKASLETEGNMLIFQVEAQDTVALRAALNAYLRWINSALNVLDVVESVPGMPELPKQSEF